MVLKCMLYIYIYILIYLCMKNEEFGNRSFKSYRFIV